ncbi:MAG: hypothetical protein JWN34_2852 [Bryobacterales bacterium]|nr:hypothetical protein [Bryobacterales bacterium]
MTQNRLNFRPQPKREKSLVKVRKDFDTRNLEIALEFLEDPDLCGGWESFGYTWACLVVQRLQPQQRAAA